MSCACLRRFARSVASTSAARITPSVIRAPRPRAQPATRPGFTVVFTLPLKVLAGLRRQLRRQGVAHRFIAEEGYLRGGLKRRVLYRFPIGFIFFRSKTTLFVIPAKAGIQFFSGCLDSRIRGNDENLFRIGITPSLVQLVPF